jgi:Rieske Fe-S protein
LSDNQDDSEKKEDSASTTQDSTSSQEQKKPARPVIGTPVNRPRIGTPIGTPVGTPPAPPASAPASQTPASPPAQRPAVGTPVQRPTIGTPVGAKPTVGTPVGAPAGSRPAVGTPVGTRPTVGTPVGAKPAVGTPVGAARPSVGTPAAAAPRPTISSPAAGRPGTPVKKPESKEEVSRRRFMKGLVALGGLVAVLQFGGLFPFLQGTVAGSTISTQAILDAITSAPITTSSFSTAVQWLTFVYPRTGNTNIDSDTFRQCVIIKLPPGFTAPADLSASDSTGTYCGFSRVCVHLWCLWSYVPTDMRMECPCHGSQYVPGSGTYPLLPIADNKPPGLAVEGPASLQVAPNNQLPMITLKINSDGSFTATGIVGQIGCGQLC